MVKRMLLAKQPHAAYRVLDDTLHGYVRHSPADAGRDRPQLDSQSGADFAAPHRDRTAIFCGRRPIALHRFPKPIGSVILTVERGRTGRPSEKWSTTMGRNHTFMDREFGKPSYDPADSGEFEEGLVFVIMPFRGQEMTDAYGAIRDECKKLRLRSKRVDENTGSGLVIREITELIERSEFIVCDLTHERPNVYYELGYAHGVGNEALDILLVAKEGTVLHFDIAPLRVHYYSSTEHLRAIISTNLKAMIKATRK
jgi:hypothetical protein